MPEQYSPFDAPFKRFGEWFEDAKKSEPDMANAVAVATATKSGVPSMRMVLMKNWGEDGFVFYTNFNSRKGQEILANPNFSMLFHWKSLMRQIRIEGIAETVSDAEAEAYHISRPRASRIGAWASRQSEAMQGRFEFEAEIARYTAKYAVGEVPRPPHWSGFRLKPKYFEFWSDRKFRLHERHTYRLTDHHQWGREILFP